MRFRPRRHIPVAVLAAALALPAAASANELPNGSFEQGVRTWSPLNARISAPAGGVHGSRHGRAVRRSRGGYGFSTRPDADLQAGQSLSGRASVRAPRGKRVCLRIRERRASGTVVATATRCVRASGNWQRPPAVGFTTRRGDTRVVLSVFARGGGKGRLHADNAVLTAAPLGTPEPGHVIVTDRPWGCQGALADFGELPVKVVSTIANAGPNDNDNAINLRGCYGDGDPATIDLILDIRGDGDDVGTSYDAVRIGQNARDLVVTGNAECGARNSNPAIHQDIVQALSGARIEFRDFTSGNPATGRWTCWGAGGGWYVTWANGSIPTDLVCLRCRLATFNQNLRIDESVRSGARDSVFGFSRSYGIFIGPDAVDPVNVNNQVIEY
ncbi:MAG TPA: hypothetical protein VD704_11275 [Gaiellaceae bacterium]|nr:hypothetical protein [Gaiellaceae bacterium]